MRKQERESQQHEQIRRQQAQRVAMQQQALAQEEARGTVAREMQAKLQIKYEPVLTQNMTEMQHSAIHLRQQGRPRACGSAVGSLWNASVCFFIGVCRLLGRLLAVACGMYRSAFYRCGAVAWEIVLIAFRSFSLLFSIFPLSSIIQSTVI